MCFYDLFSEKWKWVYIAHDAQRAKMLYVFYATQEPIPIVKWALTEFMKTTQYMLISLAGHKGNLGNKQQPNTNLFFAST